MDPNKNSCVRQTVPQGPQKTVNPPKAVHTQVETTPQATNLRSDNILPTLRPLCQVICQIGPNWTEELFFTVLERNLRIFYYDLAWTEIDEAEETLQRLEMAAKRLSAQMTVPVITSLLVGIQERDRQIGFFRNPDRKEISLKKGARFIVSADRRMLRRGSSVAVYCNCAGIIEKLSPRTLIFIGPDVVLSINKIVNISLVCSVTNGGPIRPLDMVRMPISTSETVVSQEEIDQMHLAIRQNAIAIVTKSPRTNKFFSSIGEFLAIHSTKLLKIFTITRTSDLKTNEDTNFISNSYDGVLHQIQGEDGPIHRELNMLQHLFENRKLSYFLSPDDGTIVFPNLPGKNQELLHYYADGFLLPTKNQIDCNSLYRFLVHLKAVHPIDSSISLHKLQHNPLVDLTRSGRRTLFRNAALASYSLNAQGILMCTKSGRSAIDMAQFRPACQILALTALERPHLCLYKAMRHTSIGSILTTSVTDKKDLHSWLQNQRIMYQTTLLRSVREKLLLLTDQIIVLSKSGPDVSYLDTFYAGTVDEYLRHSQGNLVRNGLDTYGLQLDDTNECQDGSARLLWKAKCSMATNCSWEANFS